MEISITIPVLNEESQLAASVRNLAAFRDDHGWTNCEIVIADNGSTDQTWPIAERLASELRCVRVVRLAQKGRGRALATVWQSATADILAYMDVDLSTDLRDLPGLIRALSQDGYDLAIGSRLLPESETTRGWKREVLSRGYNWLIRRMLHTHFSDAQCGFKAINKKAAARLLPLVKDTNWFFDTELLVWAEWFDYRIYEQPVKWTDDSDSRVKILGTITEDLRGLWRLRPQRKQAQACKDRERALPIKQRSECQP